MLDRNGKIVGVACIIAAFLIASLNSLLITGPSILDTDPATYIIAPMLMLFLFLGFVLKEDLELAPSMRNVAYGAVLLATYLAIFSIAKVSLSYLFLTYRIDALLLPILLAAMITALFGPKGVGKFKYALLYAFFACPLTLMPVLSMNGAFASANAVLVYSALLLIGIPVTRSGVTISAPFSNSISISTTCVSLGTFAALLMFMLPLAYVYSGSRRSKAAWIGSGLLLMLGLNVARMLSVTLMWVYYGLGSAVSTFHLFAGQVVFYISIAVMMLAAQRYGLRIMQIRRGELRRLMSIRQVKYGKALPAIAAVFAFAIAGYSFSINYHSAVQVPLMGFGRDISATGYLPLYIDVLNSIRAVNPNATQVGSSGAGMLFLFQNASGNGPVYVLATPEIAATAGKETLVANSTSLRHAQVVSNGVTLTNAQITAANATYYVTYLALPYTVENATRSVNYLAFEQVQSGAAPGGLCSYQGQGFGGTIDAIESAIYDAFAFHSYRPSKGFLCPALGLAMGYQLGAQKG